MWTIYSEPMVKTSYASPWSRSYCLSLACHAATVLVPLLALTTIGNLWTSLQVQILTPLLQYDNYQIQCLLSDGSTLYDSSFSNDSDAALQTVLSAGAAGTVLKMDATISASTHVVSCAIGLYIYAILNNNLKVLSLLPISVGFPHPESAVNLAATLYGSVEVLSLGTLSSSYLVNDTFSGYFEQDSATGRGAYLTLPDALLSYTTRPLQLTYESDQTIFTPADITTVSLTARIRSGSYTSERPLIDNLRVFAPIYIFACVFFWRVIARPIIQWLVENRVYLTRTHHPSRHHDKLKAP